MTGNESLSALRSGMNSLRLRLFGVWLLAVGGGAVLAGVALMDQAELWTLGGVLLLGMSMTIALRMQHLSLIHI